jgi:type IV pilus assembly protein PilN
MWSGDAEVFRMILINLLPYREERRKRRKQAFFAGIALSVLVGVGVVSLGWLLLQQQIDNQRQRNDFLSRENAKLDDEIKSIASLRQEIEDLVRRQKAVEALQGERNLPVNMLNELVRLAPEGVYLTAVKQTDRSVQVTGLAQTQERVSEFLRSASRESEWLIEPKLDEIKLANVSTNARDAKRLFDFSIKLKVKSMTPEPEPKKTGAAAAGKG